MSPFITVIFVVTLSGYFPMIYTREYCWEMFNATCKEDEVVVVQTAHYGRMKIGICLTRDYFVGCVANILPQMERKCSGRRSCSLDVPDPELHKTQPCPKDLLAYLDITYTCVKVAFSDDALCKPQRNHSLSGLTTGYISNTVTEETNHGSPSCPWIIIVPQGQRINVTLVDFAALGTIGRTGSHVCTMYAVIRESFPESSTGITVCGGERREKALYLSERNSLIIEIMNTHTLKERPYFLLKYEAVGCVDLKPPPNGWIKRQGDKATVSCNFSTDIWHLVCSGDSWVGGYKNCSGHAWSEDMDGQKSGDHQFPFGVFIAVAIGIALGVFTGLLLLSTVMCCRKDKTSNLCKYGSQDPDSRWKNALTDEDIDFELEKARMTVAAGSGCYDRFCGSDISRNSAATMGNHVGLDSSCGCHSLPPIVFNPPGCERFYSPSGGGREGLFVQTTDYKRDGLSDVTNVSSSSFLVRHGHVPQHVHMQQQMIGHMPQQRSLLLEGSRPQPQGEDDASILCTDDVTVDTYVGDQELYKI